MPDSIPQSVVRKDHELEAQTERSSEALAQHRWHHTLDPKGPQHSVKAYARAVGRHHSAILRSVNGYAMFTERGAGEPGSPLSIQDAIRLAGVAVEKRAMTEAIAEGSGQPVANVARGDNFRTKLTIERAHQRAERRGGDPVEHARDIAAQEARLATADRRRRTEEKQRHTLRYVHIEGHLANAQRRLLEALKEAQDVGFSEEELELIRDSVAKVRAVLDLIDARMAGSPNIDWDAELARLGEDS